MKQESDSGYKAFHPLEVAECLSFIFTGLLTRAASRPVEFGTALGIGLLIGLVYGARKPRPNPFPALGFLFGAIIARYLSTVPFILAEGVVVILGLGLFIIGKRRGRNWGR